MSDDLLGQATSALRDTTVATRDQLEAALTRLERARRPRASSRRRWYTWAWTLASCFVGVGAWANATGRVNWFEFSPSVQAPAPSPPEPLPPAPPRSASPAIPTPEPLPEVAAELEPEPPVAPPSRRAPARREPTAPAPEVTEPPVAAAPAPDPADTLYRAAHTAHFAKADYEGALDAWDRYLDRAAPSHRFWLEARFNRAIALYRLRRFAAAREALIPFAGGEYGGYRRADAERLLDAIDER